MIFFENGFKFNDRLKTAFESEKAASISAHRFGVQVCAYIVRRRLFYLVDLQVILR